MRVVVAGASGLIGSSVVARLRAAGHSVLTLVRRAPEGADEVRWDPAGGALDPVALKGVHAAINLAGAGIGDHRWTDRYRRVVHDSRVMSTLLLTSALAALQPRPAVLLSASAVGYYGDRGDEMLDEGSEPGSGFLADLCQQWEQATGEAADAGIRVCFLRSGVVLSPAGGVLGKLLPIYRLGFGGPLGSGRQWQSWISLTDETRAIEFLLNNEQVSGPVNLTAPEPVRQRAFARALGRAVHRPAVLPAPALALRLALGGFADEGVLASQRVVPRALTDAGFEFRDPHLSAALARELS